MWVKTLTRAVVTAQIIVYKLLCVHRSRLKLNVFYATNTRRTWKFSRHASSGQMCSYTYLASKTKTGHSGQRSQQLMTLLRGLRAAVDFGVITN